MGVRHTGQPPLFLCSVAEHSSQQTRWPQSNLVVRSFVKQTRQSGNQDACRLACAAAMRRLADMGVDRGKKGVNTMA